MPAKASDALGVSDSEFFKIAEDFAQRLSKWMSGGGKDVVGFAQSLPIKGCSAKHAAVYGYLFGTFIKDNENDHSDDKTSAMVRETMKHNTMHMYTASNSQAIIMDDDDKDRTDA